MKQACSKCVGDISIHIEHASVLKNENQPAHICRPTVPKLDSVVAKMIIDRTGWGSRRGGGCSSPQKESAIVRAEGFFTSSQQDSCRTRHVPSLHSFSVSNRKLASSWSLSYRCRRCRHRFHKRVSNEMPRTCRHRRPRTPARPKSSEWRSTTRSTSASWTTGRPSP